MLKKWWARSNVPAADTACQQVPVLRNFIHNFFEALHLVLTELLGLTSFLLTNLGTFGVAPKAQVYHWTKHFSIKHFLGEEDKIMLETRRRNKRSFLSSGNRRWGHESRHDQQKKSSDRKNLAIHFCLCYSQYVYKLYLNWTTSL